MIWNERSKCKSSRFYVYELEGAVSSRGGNALYCIAVGVFLVVLGTVT